MNTLFIILLAATSANTNEFIYVSMDASSGTATFYSASVAQPNSARAIGKLEHAKEESVHASLAPSGVFAVANRNARDSSDFPSTLFLVTSSTSNVLAEKIAYASRPFSLPTGEVAVVQKLAPTAAVTLNAIDEKGKSRELSTFSGLMILPIAMNGAQLMVYRIGNETADIAFVNTQTEKSNVEVILPSLEPTARDFSFDEPSQTLAFVQADRASRRFCVKTFSLKEKKMKQLQCGSSMALLPQFVPQSKLVFQSNRGAGLHNVTNGELIVKPLGNGYERVVSVLSSTQWLVSHETPSQKAEFYILNRSLNTSQHVKTGENENVEFVGLRKQGAP